jgi:hypothetical protein
MPGMSLSEVIQPAAQISSEYAPSSWPLSGQAAWIAKERLVRHAPVRTAPRRREDTGRAEAD